MSKLAELIRRATRVEAAPIGFGPVRAKAAATMLLVALLDDRSSQGGDAVAAGADVLLHTGRPSDRELAQTVSAAEGRPCGLLGPQADADGLARLRTAGLDFVVLEPRAPASALLDQQLGFVLHLKGDSTDSQLRALDALPLDSILLEREAMPLTIQRQADLQRLSGLTRKALLLPIGADAAEQDLVCLRDAHVALVALALEERGALDALRRLRGLIDGLPARRRRREERPEATLPQVAAGEAEEEDDEE